MMTTTTTGQPARGPDPEPSLATAPPPTVPSQRRPGSQSWFGSAPAVGPVAAPMVGQDPPTSVLPAVREPAPGPPAPRITQQPPPATGLPAAGFSWAIRPGLAYESRLDDAPWAVCPGFWYALFIDLPAGPHRFYVRSVDGEGQRSAESRYDWVVAPLDDSTLSPR